jgi:LemA protein
MLTVVYYYNLLLDMRYNVQEAAAQIQVAEQKRTHVRSSLTELVRYYARYERELMREVTTLRTAEKPLEGASVQQLIARLDAVAEQYPQLHLTKSIEQFVTAINQTETEIAERIAAYNKIVNDYTTLLNQFPAKVYGAALGFENMEFYRPSANVLGYHDVQP